MTRLILTPDEEQNQPALRDSNWKKFFKWFNLHKDLIAFILTFTALIITMIQGCANLNYIRHQTRMQDSMFAVSRVDKMSDNRKQDSLSDIQDSKERRNDSALRTRDEHQNAISELSVKALKDQSQTSRLQYELQDKLYNQQLLADRGRVSMLSVELSDKEAKVAGVPAPKVVARLANIGKRDVLDLGVVLYYLNLNYTIFSDRSNDLLSKTPITPGNGTELRSLPKFRLYDSVDDFYLCAVITYRDEMIKTIFEVPVYLHYYSIRGQYAFYDCSSEQINKIENAVMLFNYKR